MKANKEIIFAMMSVFLFVISISLASSLLDSNGNVAVGIWYSHDTGATSATVQNGDIVRFTGYAHSVRTGLSVRVEIIGQGTSVPLETIYKSYSENNQYGIVKYGIGSEGDFEINSGSYGVGTYKIRITATGDQTDTLELDLIVQAQPPVPQNNVPVFISAPLITVIENQAYSYDADANDPEGQTLIYSLIAPPTWLSINAASGLVTGTAPTVTANTLFNVVVSVSDGSNSASQQFDIIVLNQDANAPVVTITFPLGTSYDSNITILNYTAVDAEGNLNQCWYSINLGASNTTLPTCSGTISINSVEGINRWTVYASDLAGNVGSDLVTFTVDEDEDDDDNDSSSNKKVTYVYQDPNTNKYEEQTQGTFAPEIDLTTGFQKSWFASLLEAIMNFFRWLFG